MRKAISPISNNLRRTLGSSRLFSKPPHSHNATRLMSSIFKHNDKSTTFAAKMFEHSPAGTITARSLSSKSGLNGVDILASFGEKSKSFEGNNIAGAMEALAHADAVCFDVDSTVITEEGIDVLADSLGKGKVVADWTAKAMTGNVKFEDALSARLKIMEPSESSIIQCLESSPLELSPGVETLIQTLSATGTDVYLVSGGFRIMIEPVAMSIGVPKDRIYANTILFDDNGDYAGFDADELTSRDLGKPRALEKIKKENGYETMIMVGDGATDAQAKPPADAFIGFGGVVVRETVKEKACWYVTDFQDMIDILKRYRKVLYTENPKVYD